MREIKLHWQKRGNEQSNRLKSQSVREEQSQAEKNKNKIRDPKNHRQHAQNDHGRIIGNRQMEDRQHAGRQGVVERGLKHLEPLVWQWQRPALLDVLNISDVIFEIVTAMERQHFRVVPKKNQPREAT